MHLYNRGRTPDFGQSSHSSCKYHILHENFSVDMHNIQKADYLIVFNYIQYISNYIQLYPINIITQKNPRHLLTELYGHLISSGFLYRMILEKCSKDCQKISSAGCLQLDPQKISCDVFNHPQGISYPEYDIHFNFLGCQLLVSVYNCIIQVQKLLS